MNKIIIILLTISGFTNLKAQTERQQPETDAQVCTALHKAEKYYRQKQYAKAFPVYLLYFKDKLFTPKHAVHLGKMYERRDENDKEDFIHATYWYRKAAKQGDAEGEYLLGIMFLTGQGVPENADSAVYWLQKSAYQNERPVSQRAQRELGYMYEKGDKVTSNLEQAIIWYQKAARQRNKAARDDCKRLGVNWSKHKR
jgi:TPR repeat protein